MSEPTYRIVDAVEQDLEAILEIATTASTFTFNAVRSTAADRVGYVRREFSELKRYWRRGQYRFLVARVGDRVVGYLFLNLHHQDDLGRRQTFVEDIGALPEYWGQGIGHALFDQATAVTAELGIDFMGGEVAASNPRWEAALRNRFQLEAYKVVRACTPNGEAQLARARQALQEQQALEARLAERRAARERRRQNRT